MSADNWAICPRCGKTRDQKVAEAKALYGKVPADEYVLGLEAAGKASDDETLREDYDIGVWDGMFRVSYRAACSSCDFRFSFQHEAEVQG